MDTLEIIWACVLILFGLGLGLAIVYLGIVAIGLVLSLPIFVASAIIGLVSGIITIVFVFKN